MLVFYHAGFPLLLSNAHSLLLALTALNIYQVGLLNVDGFYDPFLSFIDMAVSEGFIAEDARRIIISAPTARELVLKLEVKKTHSLHCSIFDTLPYMTISFS